MNIDVKIETGAIGDGARNDTGSFQSAFDRVHDAGGGTVRVPAGTYRVGSLQLRSHTWLVLEPGAVLLGDPDPAGYPVIGNSPDLNLKNLHAHLWADTAENIGIVGHGAIDGGVGLALQGAENQRMQKFRPVLLYLHNCRSVTVEGITLRNSNFWTFHLKRCTDVTVRGLTIRSHPERINTDGIDPDCCRNVVISDCNIESGDDSIVIKATEPYPCENILVSNCILKSNECAFKLGTESIGSIRNVSVTNCVIRESRMAIALYMKDGSVYENVHLDNLVMQASAQFPVLVDITPRYHGESTAGRIRNILMNNMSMSSPGRILIEGTRERPVENLTISNMTWDVTGPILDPSPKPSGSMRIRLNPDAVDFTRNAHQIIAAHVRDLTISGLRLYWNADTPCDRGILYLNTVADGLVENIRSRLKKDAPDSVVLKECENVSVSLRPVS